MNRFEGNRQRPDTLHAQAYLAEYRALVAQRDTLLDTLEDLQKAKRRAAVFTGELLVRRRAEGQTALLTTLNELERSLAERLQLIEQMPVGTQRTILLDRYINGWAWLEIERRMGYSERAMFALHKRALVSVEGLLAGVGALRVAE
jgi:hypothetical protein